MGLITVPCVCSGCNELLAALPQSLQAWGVALLGVEVRGSHAESAAAPRVRRRARTGRRRPVTDSSDLTQTSALFLTAVTRVAARGPPCGVEEGLPGVIAPWFFPEGIGCSILNTSQVIGAARKQPWMRPLRGHTSLAHSSPTSRVDPKGMATRV